MKSLARFVCGRGAAWFVLALVQGAFASQNPPQSPQIRVSTHLVQIGVIVRDSNGPVANLTKDDFTALDRGKPQRISVFSVQSTESPSHSAQPLPPNTFSDLPQYGTDKPRSITIVLLDNLNTLYGSSPQPYETKPYWLEDLALTNARSHLVEFIKELDSRDRVAIYGLTNSLHILCDFTSDRSRLLAILKKYDTTSLTNREEVEPGAVHTPVPGPEFNANVNSTNLAVAAMANANRASVTMAALMSIVGHVSNIPGRKNLVWLTAAPPFPAPAMARVLTSAQIAVYPVDGRGLLTEDGDAVARGVSMPAQSPQPIGIETMQELADDTGGQAAVNTNDLTGAIRAAVANSIATYTLGFYIEGDSIDGKFHRLKVEVKRKGVTARYPRGYFAFQDGSTTSDENHKNLLTAVRSPIESSMIPVRVRIERVERPLPHALSLFGSVDIRGVRLVENGAVRQGAVDIITVEQDESGKVLAQSASTINLQFADKRYSDYLSSGFPFHQLVQPQAGATTLRILVQDPNTAQVGSIIIPLARVN